MYQGDIKIPNIPLLRPWKGESRRPKPLSLMMGFGVVLEPDGSVAWQEDDWAFNMLHDAGEQEVGQVFFQEATHKTKFFALLNDASVAETDGTMSAVTESKATPPQDGYARQPVTAGQWTNDGLQGGDYRFSAIEVTFGAITGTALTATHAAMCTTATTAGLLLTSLALSATTTVAVGQQFKYIGRNTLS